jgi:hypothetical protein
MKRVNQFLDYMWTHPDAIIWYRASDMILNVHSDASYLSAPRARSRAGGYFFLGSLPCDGDPIKLNGAIHVTCTILKLVAASAAEAELGALFLSECARSKSIPTSPCRTRTSTTTYTNSHRQHNHSQYRKQHHQTSTIKIDGNGIFLVIRR